MGFIKNIPGDLRLLFKSLSKKKNLPGLAIVAGSTAIMIWQDQQILDAVKQFAGNIHFNPETKYQILLKMGSTKIIKILKK